MIPTNINREHVLKAIEEIDKHGVPDSRLSHDYNLRFNGKDYPPKYIISIANKFINKSELDSREFGGGEESNGFLKSRGFEIIASDDALDSSEQKSDFAGSLKKLLESNFSIEVTKYRNHLTLPSGTSIHVRGSRILPGDRGFYYLLEEDFNDTVKNPNRYFSIVFGTVDKTFVLPPQKLKEIFEGQTLTRNEESKPKWYFDVIIIEDEHYLKLATGSKGQYQIDDYLNKWEQIPELTNSSIQGEKSKRHLQQQDESEFIFVTGYDDRNLEISKKQGILGWAKNSTYLSEGSLVFVYNLTDKNIESCFKVKSKSDSNTELIWADEVHSNKVIYPNRWNAELIYDGIIFPVEEINRIPPFDSEPFQGLLKNFPMPVNSPQNKSKYETFLNNLLGSINSQSNYWIFVVTNKESLSAEEVYRARMSEKFWGLNEGTKFRRYLKKGDKVIFSHGAKTFLGTAILDSDSFELDQNQSNKFSRDGVFKTDYGVMLSNIVMWEQQTNVGDYVNYISFITNKDQYSYYFQGGVKRITKSDYDIITKNSSPNQDTVTNETLLWLVRAGDKGQGEQIALEKNLVGIGYGGLSGLDQIRDFKIFKEHFIRTHPNDSPWRVGQVVPQIWNFMTNIKAGDLVVLPLKTKHSREIAVGQIIGGYKNQDLNPEIQQFRPVKWFKKDIPRNDFDPEFTKNLDVQGTVFQMGESSAVNKIKVMLDRLGIDTSSIIRSTFENEIPDYDNTVPSNDIRSWLSLMEQEIYQVIDRVLNSQGRRLEIEPSVLYRIISHLILSKHVILVGAPGTGKTDLARRLLRELGQILLGKAEPIERVASYEWGRYEVIGGMSLTPDSEGNLFHLGCVTHAIKEGKLLLIDEFNRADMNKAFGEMFLAIDHGVIQLKEDENPLGFKYKSRNEIEIPTKFRMICTMNDYDKSLLNELSYGLLRRFAFVTIDIPKDAKKVKEVTIERAKHDLNELDELVLEKSIFKIEKLIDKFIEFLLAIREKRQIGISSYIDVIKYILHGVSTTSNNPWEIMNNALIDYIIPQFDRLDFDTLDFALKYAQVSFRDDSGIIPELQPFLSALNEKVRTLQNLNKLFSSEDTG